MKVMQCHDRMILSHNYNFIVVHVFMLVPHVHDDGTSENYFDMYIHNYCWLICFYIK